MILSVSRRTDILSFYLDWFLNRIQAGYLLVKNPINPKQVSRISLSRQVVDCLVFWTKNPVPMLPRLAELQAYPYYIQFTLTPYGREIEPGLPDKRTVLIPAFQTLARALGPHRVIWRYDPICLSPQYTIDDHIRAFSEMAALLDGSTSRVVISFLDLYQKTRRNTAGLELTSPDAGQIQILAAALSSVAHEHHMDMETCCESVDLSAYGIRRGACIDQALIEQLLGCRLHGKKDKNQRSGCGCMESIDIGAYHTCKNFCRYCYANFSPQRVLRETASYDPHSPLLCGSLSPEDCITDRAMHTLTEPRTV